MKMKGKKRTGLIAGLIIGYALLEPYWHKVKRYKLSHTQIPEGFDGYKIAFLADIHFGRTLKSKTLRKMVDKVNDWEPDLVILGGDYVMHKKHIYPCFKELSRLKAKHGVHAVMGNHDVVESFADTKKAMRLSNVNSINNDALWLEQNGDRIRLGGVGDMRTQTQNIEPTIKGTKFDDYIILVTHNPRYIYQLKPEDDINLILAGHTHGGQFSFIKHLSHIVPNFVDEATALSYLSGYKEKNGRHVIVSNGMGTARFAMRIMTRPEMVYITLNSTK
ncbi:MAG: hypothetical protein ATN35_07835 [Epulopiscium sp. Nele67-Bin004]|nr:MAG: hypothetical protein ATN35_07835 [Epulopiscium sp. Nele67-Bin004]